MNDAVADLVVVAVIAGLIWELRYAFTKGAVHAWGFRAERARSPFSFYST